MSIFQFVIAALKKEIASERLLEITIATNMEWGEGTQWVKSKKYKRGRERKKREERRDEMTGSLKVASIYTVSCIF